MDYLEWSTQPQLERKRSFAGSRAYDDAYEMRLSKLPAFFRSPTAWPQVENSRLKWLALPEQATKAPGRALIFTGRRHGSPKMAPITSNAGRRRREQYGEQAKWRQATVKRIARRRKQIDLECRYGCRRPEVRRALDRLSQKRLVRHIPNRGYQVFEVDDRRTNEISDIRVILEIAAADRMIANAPPESIGALRRLAKHFDNMSFFGTILEHYDANLAFHRELLLLAGNGELVELSPKSGSARLPLPSPSGAPATPATNFAASAATGDFCLSSLTASLLISMSMIGATLWRTRAWRCMNSAAMESIPSAWPWPRKRIPMRNVFSAPAARPSSTRSTGSTNCCLLST